MAAYTQIGYSVADIAALKAIPPADRPAFAGALVSVVSTNQWFEFDPSGTTGGVVPDSGSGRWYPMSREVLNANRTYFVRTDGSDSNNGLANSSGGAFLTIQKAIDVVASLDIGIYNVSIRVGSGTFTTPITLKSIMGSGTVTLRGDNNDNTSTIISVTNADAIGGYFDGKYSIEYLKIQTTTSGACLAPEGFITFGNVNFGICAGAAQIVLASSKAQYRCYSPYTISGGAAQYHIACLRAGYIEVAFTTITLTGTPNFTLGFIWSAYCAQVLYYSNTIVGSATGPRHLVQLNAVLFTGGLVLPGSIAGTTATGGQVA